MQRKLGERTHPIGHVSVDHYRVWASNCIAASRRTIVLRRAAIGTCIAPDDNPVVDPVPPTNHRVITTVLNDVMFRHRNSGQYSDRLQGRRVAFMGRSTAGSAGGFVESPCNVARSGEADRPVRFSAPARGQSRCRGRWVGRWGLGRGIGVWRCCEG